MKTLNLETLGVQEMDAEKMKSTNGGVLFGLLFFVLGAALGYLWVKAE
ncbi:MAG: hypothetical protein HC831_29935 [Chloroflexia bacterium]|nr:hypothetical protein [Chloroflexia bacterium]